MIIGILIHSFPFHCIGTSAALAMLTVVFHLFLGINRFKQARHILSVYYQLISTSNGREEGEHAHGILQALYLSVILNVSKILRDFRIPPEYAKYFMFDYILIPCELNLPKEENPLLPIHPLETETDFKTYECMLHELRNSIHPTVGQTLVLNRLESVYTNM